MQTTDQNKKGLKSRIYRWLGLTTETTIKVYHGYGHADQLMIHGHVFRLSPLPRKKYRKSFIRNTLALLRLFIVKPFAGIKVKLEWKKSIYYTETDRAGFFKFEWKDEAPSIHGWQEV